jgi:hypothetical protein
MEEYKEYLRQMQLCPINSIICWNPYDAPGKQAGKIFLSLSYTHGNSPWEEKGRNCPSSHTSKW